MTNYPKILKYAVGDRLYTLEAQEYKSASIIPFFNGRSRGFLRRVMVTGWRAVVTLDNNQSNYYTVKEIVGYDPESQNMPADELYNTNESELPESKLFSSPNHLLSSLKQKYINSTYNSDNTGSQWFVGWGALDELSPGFADNNDLAGMNLKGARLYEVVGGILPVGFKPTHSGGYTGLEIAGTPAMIFDNTNFEEATMFVAMDTKNNFRTNTFSYDAETTIWTDGFPVGRQMSGSGAGASGGTALTGTSTQFTAQISIGDQIVIETIGVFSVVAIGGDTSLTVAPAFPSTFSGKTVSRI